MEFTLNRIKWKIVEVDSNDPHLVDQKKECVGLTDYKEKIIYLDKSINQDFKERVLLHELAHAFMDSYLLKSFGKFDEEEMVEFVSLYARDIITISDKYFKEERK